MMSTDLSSAYSQLAEFQTKFDEDDHILSRLQQDSADHHAATGRFVSVVKGSRPLCRNNRGFPFSASPLPYHQPPSAG